MPWAAPYASGADLAGWLGVDFDEDDTGPALATEAASRAIDQATGRQFGQSLVPEPRSYLADYHRGQTVVDIDDTMDADLTVTGVDEFTLLPRNAAAKGRPFTQLVIPGHVGHEVEVTALWGWSEVPDPIKLATLIQASRLYGRRDNTGGQLTRQRIDDVEYDWSASGASQDLDPDVQASIAAFRRVWAAA